MPLPGVEPIVAHRHLMAPLQHVERLVLALVDMRRGAGPWGVDTSIEPPMTCQFSPQLQRTAQQPITG